MRLSFATLRSFVWVAVTALLLCTATLHWRVNSELAELRVHLEDVLQADLSRWQHLERNDLTGIRADYDVASGLSGDISASHVLLRRTTATLNGGKVRAGRGRILVVLRPL